MTRGPIRHRELGRRDPCPSKMRRQIKGLVDILRMVPFCPLRGVPAMSTLQHHFVISSRELADWLDSQPDCWWVAGPDDLLVSKANFPCPSDELAAALREVNKNIIIHTDKMIGIEGGRRISGRELPLLADTQN